MNIQEIEKGIRAEVATVGTQVALFLIFYLLLILLGIGLLVGATWVTIELVDVLAAHSRVHSPKAYLLLFILWLGMWWFCLQMAWCLFKPLFARDKSTNADYMEVQQSDCPALYEVIRDVAHSTGNEMPKHVYLTNQVNACVFYDSTNLWSLFLPTRKDLMIGVPLAYGMSQQELKSVLAHEFGHFSQKSMKAGSVTYRLMLVIETMVRYAKEQREKAIRSKAENNSWINQLFHIASGPMSLLTRLMTHIYDRIDVRSSSLSRYMEFEADAVACQLTCGDNHISALYKIEVLHARHTEYQSMVDNLVLDDHQYAAHYFQGFATFDQALAQDEGFSLSFDCPMLTPHTDQGRHPSRITLIESHDSHPTLAERVAFAAQFSGTQPSAPDQDAMLWFTPELLDRMGIFYQRYVWCFENDEKSFDRLPSLDFAALDTYMTQWLEQNHPLHFLVPFSNMSLLIHDRPDAQELATPIPSPITEHNREMLLHYQAEVNDLFQLQDLAQSGTRQVKMDGEICDIQQAIHTLEEQVAADTEEREALTRNIYIYLCQHSDEADDLWTDICLTSYADDKLYDINEMHLLTVDIRNQVERCNNDGRTYYLDKETETRLFSLLKDFVQGLDYDRLMQWCSDWKCDDETFEQCIQRWRDYIPKAESEDINANELIELCEELYKTFQNMSNGGKNQWIYLIEKVYRHE